MDRWASIFLYPDFSYDLLQKYTAGEETQDAAPARPSHAEWLNHPQCLVGSELRAHREAPLNRRTRGHSLARCPEARALSADPEHDLLQCVRPRLLRRARGVSPQGLVATAIHPAVRGRENA